MTGGGDFGLLAGLADAEFDGRSWNGRSLMGTLRGLTAAQAASEATLEGYSAWSVALHLARCKWIVGAALLDPGEEDRLGAYPYPPGLEGFFQPEDTGDGAWAALLDYLPRVHRLTLDLIRTRAADRFEVPLPVWNVSLGEAAVWLCSHDTCHGAQIRNMGVPGLKAPRAF